MFSIKIEICVAWAAASHISHLSHSLIVSGPHHMADGLHLSLYETSLGCFYSHEI